MVGAPLDDAADSLELPPVSLSADSTDVILDRFPDWTCDAPVEAFRLLATFALAAMFRVIAMSRLVFVLF